MDRLARRQHVHGRLREQHRRADDVARPVRGVGGRQPAQSHPIKTLVFIAYAAGALPLHLIEHLPCGLHAVSRREVAAVQRGFGRRSLHRLNRDEALLQQRAFELGHIGSCGLKFLRSRHEVSHITGAGSFISA